MVALFAIVWLICAGLAAPWIWFLCYLFFCAKKALFVSLWCGVLASVAGTGWLFWRRRRKRGHLPAAILLATSLYVAMVMGVAMYHAVDAQCYIG